MFVTFIVHQWCYIIYKPIPILGQSQNQSPYTAPGARTLHQNAHINRPQSQQVIEALRLTSYDMALWLFTYIFSSTTIIVAKIESSSIVWEVEDANQNIYLYPKCLVLQSCVHVYVKIRTKNCFSVFIGRLFASTAYSRIENLMQSHKSRIIIVGINKALVGLLPRLVVTYFMYFGDMEKWESEDKVQGENYYFKKKNMVHNSTTWPTILATKTH